MQFPLFGGNEITMTKTAKAKTFGEILFEVSTKPNVPGWGTTTGDTKVTHGTEVELTATPNYGYVFVEWDDGCKDSTRKVTVTDAQNYVAIFKKDKFGVNTSTVIQYNTANAGIEHKNYGSVSGAGTYEYLDNATLIATPSSNYVFAGWDINGDGVVDSTTPTTTIVVDKVYNVRAYFKPATYTITVKSNNNSYGSAQVTQGGNKGASLRVEYGSNVQLTAASKNSALYIFSKWNDNIANASRTVTVKRNETYTANFIMNTCTVTFYNEGNVVGQATVIKGSSVSGSQSYTNSKMPKNPMLQGYTFSEWKYNNTSFTSKTKVNSDISVSATWKYKVSLNAKGGSVDWTSQNIDKGVAVTLPTPKLNHYNFGGWKASDGKVYNGDSSYTFGGSVSLTAVWSCKHDQVSLVSTYKPYCRDIYSNGQLRNNKKEAYNEYECDTCGYKWKVESHELIKHYRMDDGSGNDDFHTACSTKHPDTHYGFCGNANSGVGGKHTWDGNYHVICDYCYKETQGAVYCNVGGKWQVKDLRKCAIDNNPGTHGCPG